jgi:dTDP-4-dehydrorhamnose reductase
MVVLVTGANGQLGQALQSIAANHAEIQFHFYASADLNILDQSAIKATFKAINPDVCVNAAAYTAVDKAETETEKAFAVNVTGAKNVAEACKDFNAILIHISTDFVFDGNKTTPYSEEDLTAPQGVYGQTKLDGEKAIQDTFGNYFILRTSWVYSQFGNNFMKTMLRLAHERDSLGVVDDQIGTPTHAVDLAEAIAAIIESKSKNFGIYNFSNEGVTSWYGFAKKIFEINTVAIDLKPIATTAFPTPAKRPKYSVLDKSKIKSHFHLEINSWEEALEKHQS